MYQSYQVISTFVRRSRAENFSRTQQPIYYRMDDLLPPVRKKKAKLRAHLSLNRTVLANERTFLAYLRTSLALFAFGITLIKVFKDVSTSIAGGAILLAGAATLLMGLLRYRKIKGFIEKTKKEGNFSSDKS